MLCALRQHEALMYWLGLNGYWPATLAGNWDGVYSDRACWGFSQKFHVMIYLFFSRLWISDPVQPPVTKCPHLYLNCSQACSQHRNAGPTFNRHWLGVGLYSPPALCIPLTWYIVPVLVIVGPPSTTLSQH